MDCPFCGKEMKEGGISTARDPVFWNSGSERIRLTKAAFLDIPEAEGFYCPDCRRIILPVPELESFSEKMMKKLDQVADKLSAATEELGKRQEEKRNQRSENRRKGKDPWEM